MSQPTSEPEPAGAELPVGAVARRLGVAPATLRTWDRRYGVGPSAHDAGSHRRYAPADVRRLEVMRRLTVDGVTPAAAARIALNGGDGRSDPAGQHRSYDAPCGGGRIVALPGADPAVRGLARAAMALDAPSASRIVSDHLNQFGTTWTWDHLLVPVLVGLGDRWEATGTCVDVEHVMSEVVVASLLSTATKWPQPSNARPVLLACAPGEQHSLPLHVLAGALAERRVASRVMGARVPTAALASAIRRSGPSAVFLWAHCPDVIAADLLEALPATRPAATIVVGGPGWTAPPPDKGVLAGSLSEAVEVLTRSALG